MLLLSTSAFAQYPSFNGISTNPANPINNQLSSKANTFFNWQNSQWQVKPLTNQGVCTRGDSITSPFFRLDNAEELRLSKDMLWDDGWELLVRRVGLNESNSPLSDNDPDVAVILYNKYTGILRVMLQTCRGADYNAAQIILKFDDLTTMKTDLLEFARGSVAPLDKQYTSVQSIAGYPYSNNNTKWFYADFPMMYDPCTPLYQSKVQVLSNLISTSEITINGKISGDIYTTNIGGKAQVQKPGSYSWANNVLPALAKFAAAYPDSAHILSEVLQFMSNSSNSNTDNVPSFQEFISGLTNMSFMKAGLSNAPFLKGALAVLNVFIGGGKKAQGSSNVVALMPLTVSLNASLQGSITTTSPYHNIRFTNPGSYNATSDPGGYPYYNEVLGVFNLLQKPEFWYERREENLNDWYNFPWVTCSTPNQPVTGQCAHLRINTDRFKLDTSTFKYVLNPAAGVTIQNMQFQLIVDGEYFPNYNQGYGAEEKRRMPPDFSFTGQDGVTGKVKDGTDLLHAKSFAKRTFKTFSPASADVPYPYSPSTAYYGLWEPWRPIGLYYGPDSVTAYLKVVLNLKRNNTTSTTQNVLYVVTYPVKLKAGGYMQYWENDATSFPDTTLLAPVDSTSVSAFCTSMTYWNSDRQNNVYLDSINRLERGIYSAKDQILLYPNPNNGQFILKIKKASTTLTSLKVMDINGRVLFENTLGNIPLDNGFEKRLDLKLARGSYIVLAITKSQILKSKFIVNR